MTGSGNPLVSIIMPAYNAECYISEAIESIRAQTYTTFELLICDDGSTDATLVVAKNYSQKDPRFKICQNKKNRSFASWG